jgi:hypothetical protein
VKSLIYIATRKSIDTNENIERIFLSVNFRGILPTEIFPRYISRELQWEKKLKQSKKNNNVSGFTNGITDGIYSVGKSIGKLIYTIHHVNYKGNHQRTKSVGIFQSSRTVHFPIALLIVVLYGQNHRRNEKSSVLFGGFLKKFN